MPAIARSVRLLRPAAVAGLTTLAVLLALGPRSLLVLTTDGPLIVALLIAAAGYGSLVTRGLRVGDARRIMLSLCLGLGVLSLAALALGLAGWLNRPVAWALVGAGALLALVHFVRRKAQHAGAHSRSVGPPCPTQPRSADARRTWRSDATDQEDSSATRKPGSPARRALRAAEPQPESGTPPPGEPSAAASPVVLLSADLALAVALGLALGVLLFAATLAPGVVWAVEARGYDVLEYHLQAPREYYEAGRVHFLPHNVYAQFPQQVEMLYLLLMHLRGGPYAAAIACQLLHAFCAVLAVFSLALWSPPGWPRRVALLLAGTTPWLVVTGSLAYVEAGLLLLASTSAGLLLGTLRGGKADSRPALLSGLCAGLAAACKYTAVALVAAPLVAGWLLVPDAWPRRTKLAAIFLSGGLVAFGPWMLRNAAWTGNPVYPLAWSVFDGRHFSDAQHRQWSRAHSLPGATPPVRLAIAARELLGRIDAPRAYRPSLFGPGLWMLAAIGALAVRDRQSALLAGWLAAAIAVWAFATHVPGRFAIPALIPAIWLAARAGCTAAQSGTVRLRTALVVAILALGAGVNLGTIRNLLAREQAHWRRAGLDLGQLVDAVPAFRAAHPASSLPAGAKLWIVGDAAAFYVRSPMHYTVVFNRDPWIEHCAARDDDPAACVRWLRDRGVRYVAFAWNEIERLRSTYGFPGPVTRRWVASLEAAGLKHVRDEGGWSIYRP